MHVIWSRSWVWTSKTLQTHALANALAMHLCTHVHDIGKKNVSDRRGDRRVHGHGRGNLVLGQRDDYLQRYPRFRQERRSDHRRSGVCVLYAYSVGPLRENTPFRVYKLFTGKKQGNKWAVRLFRNSVDSLFQLIFLIHPLVNRSTRLVRSFSCFHFERIVDSGCLTVVCLFVYSAFPWPSWTFLFFFLSVLIHIPLYVHISVYIHIFLYIRSSLFRPTVIVAKMSRRKKRSYLLSLRYSCFLHLLYMPLIIHRSKYLYFLVYFISFLV